MDVEKSFFILFGVVFIVLFLLVVPWFRNLMRRKELLSSPLKEEWRKIISGNVPIYRRVPGEFRSELHGLINVFLSEKNFEGCGGLQITDEIRLCVAAQACILLLNRKTNFFPTLSTVLIYPGVYFAKGPRRIGNQMIEDETTRLGESWTGGTVVLSWDHVKHEAVSLNDGQNVVLHEFAHQLDQEDGVANGLPVLGNGTNYIEWARILSGEYENLKFEVAHGVRDVIDAYGATNPAEFFAVATETFFEIPERMKARHPDLYEEFKKYYNLDPASWKEELNQSYPTE